MLNKTPCAEPETVRFSLKGCSIGRLRFDASALLKATVGHFATGGLAALALASGFRPRSPPDTVKSTQFACDSIPTTPSVTGLLAQLRLQYCSPQLLAELAQAIR